MRDMVRAQSSEETRTLVTTTDYRGLSLAEIEYPNVAVIPEHVHAETHFCLALQGRCAEFSEGRIFEHRRFTASFLPAGFTHAVHYKEGGFRWLRMTVTPIWAERFDSCLEGPLNPTHSSGGKLNDLFLRILDEYRSPDTLTPLVIEALACEMFAEVSRRTSRTERIPPQWLFEARDYLEANFLEHVKLETIAKSVRTHPVHLAREFRRHFSCTIGEFIRQKRVNWVCRQLASSQVSLVETALAAGFCDQSHLTRIFKKVTGITPAQYRIRSTAKQSSFSTRESTETDFVESQ
jgi:AraC family transcriptional regulator